MDITWHGNTCFTLKGKNITALINPDQSKEQLKGDIALLSSPEQEVKADSFRKVISIPGEYEIQEAAIIGFQAWEKSKSKEDEKEKGKITILYCLDIEGIKIVHLGELGHTLTSDMVNQLGDVDILMIGSTKDNLEDKKAIEIIEAIDPRAVLPMGVKNNPEFLKQLGVENAVAEDKYTVKSIEQFPEDKRTYIVLKKA